MFKRMAAGDVGLLHFHLTFQLDALDNDGVMIDYLRM